ncbi:MAG: alanine racemase, partial [Promicromonosporaceae bacterium]|nr:alanine racemase [Promicromonosporaceae bacterium]
MAPEYPARAVVDLAAIRHNVATLRRAAAPADVMAVVKADAYGHGMIPVAEAAVQAGATWLGTAQASEALHLREAGITSPRILTWLHAPDAPYEQLIQADIDISVGAAWALEAVAAAARAVGQKARVHLKLDTGLGRNGIMPADLPAIAARAAELEATATLEVVGAWSHLAYADEIGHPTVLRQHEVFQRDFQVLLDAGLKPSVRHIANSAATLFNPELHFELVRPGLSLYGYSPNPAEYKPSELGLIPAMTLEADFATIKDVPAGTGVSYSHQYHTAADTKLGIVPLGYADGIPRHASGSNAHPGAPVRVGGGGEARDCRIAGRVCMDQFVLDLGADATEQPGDSVTLFGASDGLAHGGTLPNAEDWAEAAGTISYEIFTRLSPRVPR